MKLKLLLFFVIPVFVYSQTANEVIKNLQDKFAQTKTLQAEFSQSIYSPQSEKPTIFKGKFYYKKENSFSINLSSRDIVSDGISVWNFDKKQNKLVISPFETGNTAFSLNEIINSYPQKCKLTLVKKNGSEFVIKSVPNDSFYSFKEAYLTINSSYLLSKMEIVDFNNMKYIFELFSIETNKEISKAKFKFNPTDEMEVIDLR
jgi:chaperone LolA